MDEIKAAILRVKLKYIESWIERRRKNAEVYNECLPKFGDILLPTAEEYSRHVYYLFVIRSKERDALQDWLASKNISTGIHYPIPIHLQEAYKHLKLHRGDLPITEKCSEEILSLPMFPELTEEEIETICENIEIFFHDGG